jgi:hypothetical protein
VRGRVTGRVRLDGAGVTPALLRRVCGYVLQDEVLPGTQTVWEYLVFHASLRLPATTSPRRRLRRVRDTVVRGPSPRNAQVGSTRVAGAAGSGTVHIEARRMGMEGRRCTCCPNDRC